MSQESSSNPSITHAPDSTPQEGSGQVESDTAQGQEHVKTLQADQGSPRTPDAFTLHSRTKDGPDDDGNDVNRPSSPSPNPKEKEKERGPSKGKEKDKGPNVDEGTASLAGSKAGSPQGSTQEKSSAGEKRKREEEEEKFNYTQLLPLDPKESILPAKERENFTYLTSPPKRSNESLESHSELSRSNEERDYDRILFSKFFRRLNDKAQVVPLVDNDHTHTRMVHSLEVFSVGRSFGRLLDKLCLGNPKEPGYFSSILQAACLAHDIGNPPFGHGGEKAFNEWWQSYHKTHSLEEIDDSDFKHFEGNAVGFQDLVEIEVTRATAAAYCKYTVSSDKLASAGPQEPPWQKKNGFYKGEAEKVFQTLGLKHRNPLAFLVEAADDLCNFAMDVEDAFRLKVISDTDALEAHEFFCEEVKKRVKQVPKSTLKISGKERIKSLKELEKNIEKNFDEQKAEKASFNLLLEGFRANPADKKTKPDLPIENLRSLTIQLGILFAMKRFDGHLSEICTGHFHEPLIHEEWFPPKRIYFNKFVGMDEVVKAEIRGAKVIKILMDNYASALLWKLFLENRGLANEYLQQAYSALERNKFINEKVYLLLPKRITALVKQVEGKEEFIGAAKRLILAASFHVFGMTDSYALEKAKELTIE